MLLEEMDRLVPREGSAQRYVEYWDGTLEPFFVKNLENVQGDERDVIFISTVYGPDAATGVVMNRFGPINGIHGHRRLNVLFTRAKYRVEVFTSMRPGDIRAAEGSQPGVHALRAYLEYAETGKLEPGETTGRESDSEFEELVRDRLQERGFGVVPQVGVAGYFIDLAVKHPKRSGYLLGIECDGASYHSSRSARDRDRLRQQVLERLQWNIYRIWSTDWFQSPDEELRRLLSHIDRLLSEEER
jgi:very-short-patch-repair endonuclease